MEITYELLKPLIVSEEWEGKTVKVKFQAPEHDAPKESSATIEKMEGPSGIGGTVASSASHSILYRVFNQTIGAVIRTFIPGFGGALVSSAAGTASVHYGKKAGSAAANEIKAITPAAKKKTVVNAFELVKVSFQYDESTSVWKGI